MKTRTTLNQPYRTGPILSVLLRSTGWCCLSVFLVINTLAAETIKTNTWYYLQWDMGNNCLDVAWARRSPGGKICVAVKHPSQVWRMVPAEGKDCYYIESNVNELFLSGPNTPDWHATQTRSKTDVWKFIASVKAGGYYIQNVKTGRHLHVLAGARDPGSLVGTAGPHPAGVWNLVLGPENPPSAPPSSDPEEAPQISQAASLETSKFKVQAHVNLKSTRWKVEIANSHAVRASGVLRVTNVDNKNGYSEYGFTVDGGATVPVFVDVNPNIQNTFWVASAVAAK